MQTSAGHTIVRTLEAHDVTHAYLVPGESFLDVLDGMVDSRVSAVVCRHEGGAGFAALSEARLTGRPGVAMVTRGPGAANAMIAVHTAWQDATPLVLFVGLIPVRDRGRESFQEFSLEGWFGTTAKWVTVIDDAERTGDVVATAFHVAATGRPGPVVVGLPEDVLIEPGGAVGHPRAEAVAGVNERQWRELDERLAASERPLIIAGGDGWNAAASQTLEKLAEALDVPVVCDWRAYDAMPHDSKNYAGWIGYGRSESIPKHLDAADLHLFIGCERTDVGAEAYTVGMGTPTVLVHADPAQTMHAGRVDQHVLASPRDFTAALIAGGGAEKVLPLATGSGAVATRGDWRAELREAHERAIVPAEDTPASGVDLAAFFAELDRELPRERVVTYGAGNATIWGHRYLGHTVPNSLVGPRNGAMGLSIPALIAAAICFPDRQAVAVCGDGDFQMNGQELATVIAEGGRPLVIVVDNGRYGTIVQHQQREYPGRPSGTDLANPQFAQLAEAYGAYGETVADNRDLRGAIRRALDSGRAALLHLVVDRELMPKSV